MKKFMNLLVACAMLSVLTGCMKKKDDTAKKPAVKKEQKAKPAKKEQKAKSAKKPAVKKAKSVKKEDKKY